MHKKYLFHFKNKVCELLKKPLNQAVNTYKYDKRQLVFQSITTRSVISKRDKFYCFDFAMILTQNNRLSHFILLGLIKSV